MPKDPFRTKPARPATPRPKTSRPSAKPSQRVKAATGGVSPGTRGGKSQGTLKGASKRSTAHTGSKRSMPRAKQGASLKRGRSR
jgi:hypothetical protein